MRSIMIISLLLMVGCTTPKITVEKENPANKITKPIMRKEPYQNIYTTTTTTYHQNQIYGCLSSDGTHSLPCMIKRAKRGLYELNMKVDELNQALGDCEDCR